MSKREWERERGERGEERERRREGEKDRGRREREKHGKIIEVDLLTQGQKLSPTQHRNTDVYFSATS